MISMTALLDNQHSENKSMIAEHGLSVWVERDGFKLLFDFGASDAALKNARRLGIDLSGAHLAVCSHSHYDHAAGFRDLAEAGQAPGLLYTGPHFFEKKYAQNGVCYTNLSCGYDASFLEGFRIGHRVVESVFSPAPGIWLVGGFDHPSELEQIPQRFVRGEPPFTVPDDFSDEICLVLEASKGLVVLVGCSHPGILNILGTVRSRFQQHIYAVVGGTHLVEADSGRIAETMEQMRRFGVQFLGLNHCSGQDAVNRMIADDFPESCYMAAGDTLVFQ